MSTTRTSEAPQAGAIWDAGRRNLELAVIGATGAVGRELIEILLAAGHPLARIDARARRAGELALGSKCVPIVPLEEGAHGRAPRSGAAVKSWDVAFLCTPSELSRTLGPELAARGVHVIDLSSAHRLSAGVPLVIPEINGALLDSSPRLVANPNCTSAIAALPLAVIERELGLDEVIVVSYQAASGAGQAGLERLEWELRHDAGVGDASSAPASPFAATLCSNVIPAIAEVDASGTSGEEQKIVDELRKILSRPDLVVEASTARVPVQRCHSVAVHLRTRRDVDLERLRAALSRASGTVLCDDPHGPRPRECAGSDPVHVGRIRLGTRGKRSLCFFAVGDQLRKGAALNAFQVAARLPLGRS